MNFYIALKLLHISAVLFWSASLLYLPGLIAGTHRNDCKQESLRELHSACRLVYTGIASPAAVIAILSGSTLVLLAADIGGWLVLKLLVVSGMVMLHIHFGRLVAGLERARAMRPAGAWRSLVVPAGVMIVAVIYLVAGKPV